MKKTKFEQDNPTAVLLGAGILNWPRSERVSDRYGLVNLANTIGGEDYVLIEDDMLNGESGKLVAVVVDNRESNHIGDLFRGLFPSKPEVGEQIELGRGRVFFDDFETVGLYPSDGRESDWLNPKALYRAHNQTVELYFIPEAA